MLARLISGGVIVCFLLCRYCCRDGCGAVFFGGLPRLLHEAFIQVIAPLARIKLLAISLIIVRFSLLCR
jgi:hypothetical protein